MQSFEWSVPHIFTRATVLLSALVALRSHELYWTFIVFVKKKEKYKILTLHFFLVVFNLFTLLYNRKESGCVTVWQKASRMELSWLIMDGTLERRRHYAFQLLDKRPHHMISTPNWLVVSFHVKYAVYINEQKTKNKKKQFQGMVQNTHGGSWENKNNLYRNVSL